MAIIKIDYGSLNGGGGVLQEETIYNNGLQYGTIETNVSSSASASDQGTYLSVRVENATNKYAWLGIKVDLTDVDYVSFYDVSISSYASNAQAVYASPTMGSASMPSGAVYQLTTGANTPHKVILDVTSLTGENYVGICVYTGGQGGLRETQCSLIELVKFVFP